MHISKFKKTSLLLLALIIKGLFFYAAAQKIITVNSPDNKIKVTIEMNHLGQPSYSISNNINVVLLPSKLGLKLEDGDFSKALSLLSASPSSKISDRYQMVNAKKNDIIYTANKKILHFQNNAKQKMDIIFQVSNDGVAFQYVFPGNSVVVKKVTEEVTSFHFAKEAKAFLQPMQVSKTGWEQTNPAYEEHYQQNIPVGTVSTMGEGWVYPALFQTNNNWVLITEAALDSNYCATRLKHESPNGEYSIGFPDAREVINDRNLMPRGMLPLSTPWRVITIGSLATIVESTLGTDLAKPSKVLNKSFVQPGKSSWSWINSKDDFIIYDEQKKYIDFAADMNWQYTLIDADWDKKIGYEKVTELAAYAATKGVGILLWYNSAGDWNTVKYTPKGMLTTKENRQKEFSRLKQMGIKGVKIDFFGGDGQSVIKYYIDILNDAAEYGLMVNFHGATLPRGWHRTYPHLVTTEAIRGFEMITFNQADANAEPSHAAMLPFTRNAFDPMDFTPMNLYKIPTSVNRKTTSAFELATSVIFLSGIQHFAESPEGMTHVAPYVKEFLRHLPNFWEDVKFIDGFPGEYVVIGRRSGSKWYIAGINGQDKELTVSVDLSAFKGSKVSSITDGEEVLTFAREENINAKSSKSVTMKPYGGFVIEVE